jgi:hypothetical protein
MNQNLYLLINNNKKPIYTNPRLYYMTIKRFLMRRYLKYNIIYLIIANSNQILRKNMFLI